MQKKIAVLLAVLLMSFVFIGCGSKNPYVGYWAEDEGVWDFGAETTINEDGTLMKNSCKNRHCPMCQGMDVDVWIDKQQENVLNTPYFHTVFTIPEELYATHYT